MADFEKAIKKVLRWEGGYVFHPADPGGETNFGITDRLDGIVDGLIDVDGDGIGDVKVRMLTEAQARIIYKREFWDKMLGDQVHDQQVAEIIFDGFVNMAKNGIRVAQLAVGVKADGVLGKNTLNALNSVLSHRMLFEDIKDERIGFYNRLVVRKPELGVFLKGWLNRMKDFNYRL